MAGLLPGGRATGAAKQVPPDGDGVFLRVIGRGRDAAPLFRAGAEAERGRVHFHAEHRREALDHESGQRQTVRVPAGFRSVPYSLLATMDSFSMSTSYRRGYSETHHSSLQLYAGHGKIL